MKPVVVGAPACLQDKFGPLMPIGNGGRPVTIKAFAIVAALVAATSPALAQDLSCWSCRKLIATEFTSQFPFIGEYAVERGVPGSNANATDYVLTKCREQENFTVGQAIASLLADVRSNSLPDIPIGGATSDPAVHSVWDAFDRWIRHQGTATGYIGATRVATPPSRSSAGRGSGCAGT
jgi:hypothetical protein